MQTFNLNIDLADFDPVRALNLVEASKLTRGRNGHVCISVLRRWASRGWKSRDGTIIVLPTIRLGGMLFVMPEWVTAFEQARVQAGQRALRPMKILTAKQQARAHEAAEKRLDHAGIGSNAAGRSQAGRGAAMPSRA